ILVRRTAMVMICAPLASTARRVSSRSLYLPVPTSSRDEYVRPAMTSGSFVVVRIVSAVTAVRATSERLQENQHVMPSVSGGIRGRSHPHCRGAPAPCSCRHLHLHLRSQTRLRRDHCPAT